ncbi:MAG: hypothetical protein IJ453_04670 [Oscillospiraceae bacterium]|nr:hypothetical protein [Oscillospiraceae bacterium]
MKSFLRKTLLFLLLSACLLGCISPAAAAEVPDSGISPQASDFFNNIRYEASPIGNGKLHIYFKVIATDTMAKLGATSVAIYKELPNSAGYSMVHSYNAYSSPSTLGTNTMFFSFSTDYSADVGANYYASFAFYAQESDGSDETEYYYSLVVKIT